MATVVTAAAAATRQLKLVLAQFHIDHDFATLIIIVALAVVDSNGLLVLFNLFVTRIGLLRIVLHI